MVADTFGNSNPQLGRFVPSILPAAITYKLLYQMQPSISEDISSYERQRQFIDSLTIPRTYDFPSRVTDVKFRLSSQSEWNREIRSTIRVNFSGNWRLIFNSSMPLTLRELSESKPFWISRWIFEVAYLNRNAIWEFQLKNG